MKRYIQAFIVLVFSLKSGYGFTADMWHSEKRTGTIRKLRPDTLTTQKMQDPIIINPKKTNQLPAVDAKHSLGIKEFKSSTNLNAKHFWLTGFGGSDKIVWKIRVPSNGNYQITILMNGKKGTAVKINSNNVNIIFNSKYDGWQRSEAGILPFNAGDGNISIEMVSKDSIEIKSIELVNTDEKEALNRRIRAFKSNTDWMKSAGYGIMVQAGGWSFPPTGDKKPWPGFAEDFDANAFVEKVDEMGGKYVVWSVSWIDYLFPAPIQTIEKLMPGRTSQRDLVADLIKACHRHHMRFMIYYHMGHGSKEVLLAKGWKDSTEQDYSSRQKWLNTEVQIFKEIGMRYGTGLDGIFCDDDCVWYPADFEKLGAALKYGNSKRLICYNPWIGPAATPFQDFYAGEGLDVKKMPFKLDNGIIQEGPQKDLQMWGCFVLDGPDWGNYKKDMVINPPKGWTSDQIVEMTRTLEKEKYSVAIDLQMYEDGSFSNDSYTLLKAAAQKLKRGKWAADGAPLRSRGPGYLPGSW